MIKYNIDNPSTTVDRPISLPGKQWCNKPVGRPVRTSRLPPSVGSRLQPGGGISFLSLLSIFLPFSSPSFSSLLSPFHLFLSPFPPFHSFRSRVFYTQLEGTGKRCELPQRGLGRSPSQNRTLFILALKYDKW